MTELDQTQLTKVEPLNEWANKPKLSELVQDLNDARPIQRSQAGKIAGWLDNLHVRGKALVKSADGSSKIVPRLIRKQAEWRYAALSEPFLSTEEVFKVRPISWEDREAAKQNQLVLNNQFNTKINKVSFIDTYIRTLVDEGTAIVMVGWESIEEKYMATEPVVRYLQDPEFGPAHDELAQLKLNSPSQFATDVPEELKIAHQLTMEHGIPIRPEIIGEKEVEKVKVVSNKPTCEVLKYENVVIDPTCEGDAEKANFIIRSFESSLSQLRKDGKYKNLHMIMPSQNSPLADPDHAASTGNSSFEFHDEPRKKLVVREYWGYWDIDGSGVVKPIVAAWVGNVLIRQEEAPFPDKKLPFVIVQYLPVRHEIYGEPDGVLIEDNQKVAGAVMRGMIDIMGKSANGQTGIRKDFLDVTNRRKFDKGQDYEFNANTRPDEGVFMHKFPEIPQSAPFMLQLQNMEAESLTGVKSFSGGISGDGLGDVAAGVRGALDAASKRELGILRRASAGIIAIARKFVSMNAEFLSEEEVVRITNDEFVTVRRDDLAGNFDLKVSISTAEEDDKKAQELAFMLQTMGPNQDPELTRMIQVDIATLRKMPDLAKKIEDYQPQPDPLAQKKMELEIAMIEAQIGEIRAKTQERLTQAGLNEAKIGTEGAKSKNLLSDADNKDLAFVEQESGVTQERELQQHGAQAKANAELKLLDHYLKQRDAKKKETK